ncbi:MAG: carboxymuconolactone decarboxylase family protein [Dehalococcoidia bacterium]
MSTPGESRWKQMVAALGRRVGLSPREVEMATEGRVKAAEVEQITTQALASMAGNGPPAEAPAVDDTQQQMREETPMVTADRAQEANEYMKERMLFTPRMFQVINTVAPAAGERFADYYETVFGDGAIPRRLKELMFVAIGVTWRSPACLIHVIPAIEAGASDEEIFEAVAVAVNGAGFVPGGAGIPYAFQYAVKVLEIAAKYRAGEPWEYIQPAEFKM